MRANQSAIRRLGMFVCTALAGLAQTQAGVARVELPGETVFTLVGNPGAKQ